MNFFLDQPQDVIINEQLVRLPINQLLEDCTTNKQLARICAGRDLWYARIRAEDPTVNVRNIDNPREYYLKRFAFGGQIYTHTIKPYVPVLPPGAIGVFPPNINVFPVTSSTVETKELPKKIVPYNDLFNYGLTIAEAMKPDTNANYLIVYSRPKTDKTVKLDVLALGTSRNVYFIPHDVPKKITLVDIIYPLEKDATFFLIENLFNLERSKLSGQPTAFNMLGQLQPIDIVINEKAATLADYLSGTLPIMHRDANTAFFQQESLFIHNKLLNAAQNPIIPVFSRNMRNIDERKQSLIQSILNTLPQFSFDDRLHSNGEYLGFINYNDFTDFQQAYVNALNEEQLQTVEFLINTLDPVWYSSSMNSESDDVTNKILGIVFDADGKMVSITE